ncbi:DUF2567 domain-containing protein [Actinophytocola sediminis]
MAEQPVGAQGPAPLRQENTAGDAVVPQPVEPAGYPEYFAYQWRPPRPKVVVRADLVPAVSVLSAVSVLGFALAWLWSVLAPAQRMVIGNEGEPVPLSALTANQAESYHRADALVIFILLGLAAGLCTGLAVWFLRARRGPVIMIAAVLGSALGGWLATLLGESWAAGRFPLPTEVEVLDVIEMAPVVDNIWVLLAWPLTTALTYGVMAAWNGMDDLGRRLG